MASSEDLLAERCAHHKGTARVFLHHLDYRSENAEESLCPRNVQRIHSVFDLEGCHRLEPGNFVPVTISSGVLARILQRSGVGEQQLKDPRTLPYLRLPDDSKLQVLHGRHRLSAAENFLAAEDRWWTVEIFDDDLPDQLAQSIKHQYRNEQNLSDGDIYRSFRQDLSIPSEVNAAKWLARLSKVKRRDVLQLHKNEPALSAALATLLPFAGLWNSLELGTLRRILGLRCSPEMVRYLQNIRRIWGFILLDDENMAGLLDAYTVEQVETLHPTLSNADKRQFQRLMSDRRIFTYIVDDAIRDRVFARLMQLDEPILSLRTFIEDTKLLEVATKPLKRLLFPNTKDSLIDGFRKLFPSEGGDQLVPIQTTDIIPTPSLQRFNISRQQSFYLRYIQLVLFCMRHFYGLTGVAPKRERGQRQLESPVENAALAFANLARLALQLGFSSETIRTMAGSQAEESASMVFVSELRPVDQAESSVTERATLVRDIATRVQQIQWSPPSHAPPIFTTNLLGLEKSHRMGRSFMKGYRFDRPYTFLDIFYGPFTPQAAEYLTTLAIRRYVFISFYGKLDLLANEAETSDRPSGDDDSFGLDHNTGEALATPNEDNMFFAEVTPVADSSESVTEVQRVAIRSSSIYSRQSSVETQVRIQLPSQANTEPSVGSSHPQIFLDHPMSSIECSLKEFIAGESRVKSPTHVTVIHCDTKRHARVLSEQISKIFVMAANIGLAMATMKTATDIERQDAKRIRGAAIRDRIVFLYERRRTGVYTYQDVDAFLSQFD